MVERVVIFGGTGFLGKRLIKNLKNRYNIVVASRDPDSIIKEDGVEYSAFKYDTVSFKNIIDGSDIVVNFSGASIAGRRWNEDYKKIMYDSRIKTTSMITDAISICSDKPHTLVSTSATGIYGSRGNETLTELSSTGIDYLANMCVDWEKSALKAEKDNVRTVCIRVGVVLDKKEGGFERMIQPFKYFVGGRLGKGKQYLPWIHVDDITRIFEEAINNRKITGIINGTAPMPITNIEFSSAVAKAMKRPNLFMVPKFMLKIIVGEFAKFLTGSQRAVPQKLLDNGFDFKYKDIKSALDNLI
ncbi:MAG: TIGR01777 family oxidoreductase [Candidatus Kapaibacterium sp.]